MIAPERLREWWGPNLREEGAYIATDGIPKVANRFDISRSEKRTMRWRRKTFSGCKEEQKDEEEMQVRMHHALECCAGWGAVRRLPAVFVKR